MKYNCFIYFIKINKVLKSKFSLKKLSIDFTFSKLSDEIIYSYSELYNLK